MYLNLFLEWVSFICMLNLIVCINILDKPKVEFQLNLEQDLYIVWYVSFCNEFFNSWSIFVHCMNIKNCKYLTYRVNTRCACICIYPSQYVCVNVHIYFVFAFAGIQIYVLSTYIHAIYMYIHVRWHAFGHVYLSWSCRFIFFFFYFSFLRKKSSFFCYPSVGWQHWALIKKNYSWSCSCYPLCEIINDFIDSWWWCILSSFYLEYDILISQKLLCHTLRYGW